jgi:SagB-type dehydrogenase family enzyme
MGVDPGARWQLSRFAYFHREGEAMALASARSDAQVLLPEPAAFAAIASLILPRTVDEVAGALDGIRPEQVRALITTLAKAGLIEAVDAHGRLHEAIDPTLQQWEFHDRLFHSRRQGGRDTFATDQEVTPAARVAAPAAHLGEEVDLVRLPAPAASPAGPPFGAVLESRRSTRRFGDPPLTLSQLGEFLFRVAGDPRVVAGTLEIFVTVDRCLGLSPGLYRYGSMEHTLERRSERTADVTTMLRQAVQSAELDRPPQVLVTLTAKGTRLASPSHDYAGVLRDVGAVFQTMYLTATAMGLGACALGAGDAAAFARAARTDSLAEPSVGELVLGTLPSP